jgi:SAM-dependent methyltransferase
VESRALPGRRVIDLGCGAGYYSVYLASQGFQVLGVDASPSAIDHARSLAAVRMMDCRFLVVDILKDLPGIEATFDFALEWEVMHHIFPWDRPRYVEAVAQRLSAGALYLSACFHLDDPNFGGKGRFRKTPLGTILYFSTEDELYDLFSLRFLILKQKIIQIPGRDLAHKAILCLMEKASA